MPTGVARKERDFSTRQSSEDVRIGWIAKRRLLTLLVRISEAGHVIQTASTDDANFCLLQLRSWLTAGMK
jgi:hypothetical protein